MKLINYQFASIEQVFRHYEYALRELRMFRALPIGHKDRELGINNMEVLRDVLLTEIDERAQHIPFSYVDWLLVTTSPFSFNDIFFK